jgi:hypothetical protein
MARGYPLISAQNGEEVVTDAMGPNDKGGKFRWVPFGAGRHRCIGFEFAQIQIRSIMSTILRSYELHLPPGEPCCEPPSRLIARSFFLAQFAKLLYANACLAGQLPEIDFTTMLHCPKNCNIIYKRRQARA